MPSLKSSGAHSRPELGWKLASHACRMFEWEISTPFGGPVVPDVYMSTATSSLPAGAGSTGLCVPLSSSAERVRTRTPASLSSASIAWSTSSRIETTVLSMGHFFATFARTFKSFASATTMAASVWLRPWMAPSSPSVA